VQNDETAYLNALNALAVLATFEVATNAIDKSCGGYFLSSESGLSFG
jgi:hypothetical protein